MKYFRLVILALFVGALTIQCTKNPKAEIERLQSKISKEDFKFDQQGIQIANELVQAYIDYAETHKESKDAPVYLYDAANLSMNLNNTTAALELFNRIIYQYPDFEKVPECMFLMGFIFENNLQNFGKAKELYEMFLARFPEHDFADDARISIDNMGKPLEELVKEFEAKNNTN
jgi:tetratricopeptide (TPR) repeat protein